MVLPGVPHPSWTAGDRPRRINGGMETLPIVGSRCAGKSGRREFVRRSKERHSGFPRFIDRPSFPRVAWASVPHPYVALGVLQRASLRRRTCGWHQPGDEHRPQDASQSDNKAPRVPQSRTGAQSGGRGSEAAICSESLGPTGAGRCQRDPILQRRCAGAGRNPGHPQSPACPRCSHRPPTSVRRSKPPPPPSGPPSEGP